MSDAKTFAAEHIGMIRQELGDAWKDLSSEAVNELEQVAQLYGELRVLQATGTKTETPFEESFADLETAVMNLAYAKQATVRRVFWETANKVAGVAGTALGNLAGAALTRAIGI